jgi:hypothetical protein
MTGLGRTKASHAADPFQPLASDKVHRRKQVGPQKDFKERRAALRPIVRTP